MDSRQIASRIAVLLGVFFSGHVVGLFWKTEGANIGLGLMIFAACAVVAGVFGAVDGRRAPADGLIRAWLWVAVGVGVIAAIASNMTALLTGGSSFAALTSSLLMLGSFVTALIAVPALVGIAAGGAAAHRSDPGQQVR